MKLRRTTPTEGLVGIAMHILFGFFIFFFVGDIHRDLKVVIAGRGLPTAVALGPNTLALLRSSGGALPDCAGKKLADLETASRTLSVGTRAKLTRRID